LAGPNSRNCDHGSGDRTTSTAVQEPDGSGSRSPWVSRRVGGGASIGTRPGWNGRPFDDRNSGRRLAARCVPGAAGGGRTPTALQHDAVIGDGHTGAVVATTGSIDLLCWPGFTRDALLGEERHSLRPIAPA
jgi:hypothetical protein